MLALISILTLTSDSHNDTGFFSNIPVSNWELHARVVLYPGNSAH